MSLPLSVFFQQKLGAMAFSATRNAFKAGVAAPRTVAPVTAARPAARRPVVTTNVYAAGRELARVLGLFDEEGLAASSATQPGYEDQQCQLSGRHSKAAAYVVLA